MDRSETARALAKAVAYVGCGKLDEAAKWLRVLIDLFAREGVRI